MKRLACLASILALLVATTWATSPAGASDESAPSIKDVMTKLHKGADSPLARLKKSLKAEPPPWPQIQDSTKDFVILGAGLAKNDPPQGDKAAYKSLAEAYFANSKAMDDAAAKKDLGAANAAFGKVSGSCMACHKAHRPR